MLPCENCPFKQHVSSTQSTELGIGKTEEETTVSYLFFFDWDDTLLAATHLSRLKVFVPTPVLTDEQKTEIKNLEEEILLLLSLALQYGPVCIVTNSDQGWVTWSCKMFLPRIVPLLEKIPVIHAKTLFTSHAPDKPEQWKYWVFHEMVRKHHASMEPDTEKHVFGFGDSPVDRVAMRAIRHAFPKVLIKTMKMAEEPTLEQLRRQLQLVRHCFSDLIAYKTTFDLALTISVEANKLETENKLEAEGEEKKSALEKDCTLST